MYHHFVPSRSNGYWPKLLQRAAMLGMFGLVLLSFAATNVQALLWQSSDWLVGAILPAVVIKETNQARAAEHLSPVVRNPVLDAAATLKAEHMAKNGYFSHYSPEGVSPWHWFKEVGYTYAFAGENLAVHFTDSHEVVEAWLDSPSHRANIVNSQYQEIGIGTAKGTFEGYDTVFVVQLFGAPAKVPTPVLAENDALGTNEVAVAIAPASAQADTVAIGEVAAVAGEATEAEPVPEPGQSTGEEGGSASPAEEAPSESTFTVPEPTPSQPAEAVKEVEPPTHEVLDLGTVATSSGLTPITPGGTMERVDSDDYPGVTALATQPNQVLHFLYLVLGTLVALSLIASLVVAWRVHATLYIVKGAALLVLMSGLFYLQVSLTDGAVVL